MTSILLSAKALDEHKSGSEQREATTRWCTLKNAVRTVYPMEFSFIVHLQTLCISNNMHFSLKILSQSICISRLYKNLIVWEWSILELTRTRRSLEHIVSQNRVQEIIMKILGSVSNMNGNSHEKEKKKETNIATGNEELPSLKFESKRLGNRNV